MQESSAAALQHARHRHEVLVYDGLEELVRRSAEFVRDGLAAGDVVLVTYTDHLWEPLRLALGAAAERVHRTDPSRVGNPARLLPEWISFVEEQAGRPVRGIGEPVWRGLGAAEVAECQIHEALLNLAAVGTGPAWLVCVYDRARLPEAVVVEGYRAHPELYATPAGASTTRPVAFGGEDYLRELQQRALPEPPAEPERHDFTAGDLAAMRAVVTHHADAAGVEPGAVEGLVLGVHEVASNSIAHGGGRGELSTWVEPGALCFEVRDRGPAAPALAGRLAPDVSQERGRGLWLAQQLCDLVQVRHVAGSHIVRVHTWL